MASATAVMPVNGPSSVSLKKLEAEKLRRMMRKKKKKLKKKEKDGENQAEDVTKDSGDADMADADVADGEAVEIEYVAAEEAAEDPAFADFKNVFEKFTKPEELTAKQQASQENGEQGGAQKQEAAANGAEEGEDSAQPKLSRKKKRLMNRLSVAQLKQLVRRPDVVEVWDTTATDPRLLVYLKSYRNSVPIPRHWCQKRKYLQGKRGIEKPPFKLPDFIENTGIAKLRAALQERQDLKTARQKMREKMQPKMGKMDIDYQVLHDAFFRYQKKPKLTPFGDMYFEGKEMEIKMMQKKPGQLSEDLKKALGMTEGAPPPWLINMQRYGPPPSYPNLKIAGLNAPIPDGAQFGYHPGGWGKPPVDEYGQPLYGDVFNVYKQEEHPAHMPPKEVVHWGEVAHEEEEPPEPGSEAASEAGEPPELAEGIRSVASVASGLETPEAVDLRKQAVQRPKEPAPLPSSVAQIPQGQLYTVLEQQTSKIGGAMFGSAHAYVLPGAPQPPEPAPPADGGQMDLGKKFADADRAEAEAAEAAAEAGGEDAESKKRKAAFKDKEKAKKYKEFKF